jgi:hypothetical protein
VTNRLPPPLDPQVAAKDERTVRTYFRQRSHCPNMYSNTSHIHIPTTLAQWLTDRSVSDSLHSCQTDALLQGHKQPLLSSTPTPLSHCPFAPLPHLESCLTAPLQICPLPPKSTVNSIISNPFCSIAALPQCLTRSIIRGLTVLYELLALTHCLTARLFHCLFIQLVHCLCLTTRWSITPLSDCPLFNCHSVQVFLF